MNVNKPPDSNKLLNTRKRLIKWFWERDNRCLIISYLHIRWKVGTDTEDDDDDDDDDDEDGSF